MSRLIKALSRLLAPAAFILLLFVFFHRLAFTNLILARGDTFLYFYPYWQAAAAALRAGRLPLWNPLLFMGAPFLANSQAGFFYPLNWPLWLLLPTPYAVSASIVLHLAIAGLGTYLAARRGLRLSPWPACLAAVLFALGGYLTAQVEHVNQLQGLAWLPWFFVVLGFRPWTCDRRSLLRKATAVAALFTLQLLAGHGQTAFISAVGLSLWAIAGHLPTSGSLRAAVRSVLSRSRLAPVMLGGGLALLLAAVQLLPALELAAHSGRRGGLPFRDVVSFSLHPLLLGRTLLPGYGETLFSEYVAYLPLTVLLLALVAALRWRSRPELVPLVVLALAGLLLALGAYNPLYWLLGRLPGFDLFRAPARWLVVYAFAAALLAAAGLQDALFVRYRLGRNGPPARSLALHNLRRPARAAALLLLTLIAWTLLSALLARWLAPWLLLPAEVPPALPTPLTILAWLFELTLAYLLLAGHSVSRVTHHVSRITCHVSRITPSPDPVSSVTLIPVIAVLSLYLAGRGLPYHQPTAPEAYFDLRPPVARLLAGQCGNPSLQACAFSWSAGRALDSSAPPARFLSLSGIFFDPGDQGESESLYAGRLSPAALYDYTIAVKHKEVIGPNLPMAYGLASVDGFDGGLLPLRAYVALTGLLLPDGRLARDGRLREYLDAVPDARWLDLFNARYLITDKVGDAWRRDVYFDLQHPVTLTGDETAAVGYLPPYEATGLWLVAGDPSGRVEITTAAGQFWSLTPAHLEDDVWQVTFPEPAVPVALRLSACPFAAAVPCAATWTVQGLSLVDRRDGSFHSLVFGDYRLIHSGDVKIYDNLDALPRALLLDHWQWASDPAAIQAALAAAGFDPRRTAVLLGSGPQPLDTGTTAGTVTFVRYRPEEVVLAVDVDRAALLLLTDAWYPGWRATLDGRPITIHQADLLFRAVLVPAGQHELRFAFWPRTLVAGAAVTVATGLLCAFLFGYAWGRLRRSAPTHDRGV